MRLYITMLAFICILTSCLHEHIEITSEYIINGNWDEYANAIEITRMKVKEGSFINPLSKITQDEILSKLEDDSSFIFFANVKYNGEAYATRKVYFNKNNDFLWLLDNGRGVKTQAIGNLQPGNWYEFSNLVTYPYYIYVYIDSTNKVHRFDVNLANY